MVSRCTGEPISWLQLEQRRLGELAAGAAARVEAHLGACEACREAAGSIADRELPPLPAVLPPARPRRAWLLIPLAAAALIALLLPRRPPDDALPGVKGMKGAGAAISLVVESGGAISRDPDHAGPRDRVAVRFTCARATPPSVEVVVLQGGTRSFPLQRVEALACGNEVAIPGAFTLDPGPARICVALGVARSVLMGASEGEIEGLGACRTLDVR